MSDIGIDLSGLIAMLVFLAAAVGLGICLVVFGLVAYGRGKGTSVGVTAQSAFGYFALAAVLCVVNLAAFVIMLVAIDRIDKDNGAFIDMIALYAWLPAQPIIWLVAVVLFNKLRKK